MPTYCFDLDDTICFPNHQEISTELKYAAAKPNLSIIRILRKLKNQDHKIIIHTARRMLTHDGDLKEILKDVADVTIKWLQDHNVPYDELIFGKPYADFYVDDKGMSLTDFQGKHT